MPSYVCPICRKSVEYTGGLPELYPFCSPRCRMADLGLWFREAYSIDRDLLPEDLGSAEPPGDSPAPRPDGR